MDYVFILFAAGRRSFFYLENKKENRSWRIIFFSTEKNIPSSSSNCVIVFLRERKKHKDKAKEVSTGTSLFFN